METTRIFAFRFWYTPNFGDWAKAATAAQAAQGALTTQSARLREMNAALGAQLLAEKGAVQDGELADLQKLRVKLSLFHQFFNRFDSSHISRTAPTLRGKSAILGR